MKISILRHLVIVGVCSLLFGASLHAEEILEEHKPKPVSLRMFKDIDFVSAFDSIYMHAVALDELDSLPEGFVRLWRSLKSGEGVVDLKDLMASLPVLYEKLLLPRSCAVPEVSQEERIALIERRLQEDEETLLEMMWEFEARLQALENER